MKLRHSIASLLLAISCVHAQPHTPVFRSIMSRLNSIEEILIQPIPPTTVAINAQSPTEPSNVTDGQMLDSWWNPFDAEDHEYCNGAAARCTRQCEEITPWFSTESDKCHPTRAKDYYLCCHNAATQPCQTGKDQSCKKPCPDTQPWGSPETGKCYETRRKDYYVCCAPTINLAEEGAPLATVAQAYQRSCKPNGCGEASKKFLKQTVAPYIEHNTKHSKLKNLLGWENGQINEAVSLGQDVKRLGQRAVQLPAAAAKKAANVVMGPIVLVLESLGIPARTVKLIVKTVATKAAAMDWTGGLSDWPKLMQLVQDVAKELGAKLLKDVLLMLLNVLCPGLGTLIQGALVIFKNLQPICELALDLIRGGSKENGEECLWDRDCKSRACGRFVRDGPLSCCTSGDNTLHWTHTLHGQDFCNGLPDKHQCEFDSQCTSGLNDHVASMCRRPGKYCDTKRLFSSADKSAAIKLTFTPHGAMVTVAGYDYVLKWISNDFSSNAFPSTGSHWVLIQSITDDSITLGQYPQRVLDDKGNSHNAIGGRGTLENPPTKQYPLQATM